MQVAKVKAAEAQGRKAKLANSYQQLLDEFASKDLKSVGNYTLGRLIGKGSFGKVYLASHKLINGSKVVLKSAKKDDSNLAREIHHHRQFVHPHIARLYEVIVTESLVWLVLEYCPGDELYNYLLKHGRLPVEKVQNIFTQLVGAVSYVHQQSCVHRDLKLENILLDKHENVKLCDFGFTREYEGKANYLQTFCGTICYSAPEMLKGEKYAGEKVDVWSLGVILYALLCGELPFDEDEDDETRRRILFDEPKYPDFIPADALALIKKLLSKRTLLRPSIPEILADPFLADFAPQQQEILGLRRPAPFATSLEKDTLERMKSAGVDIDSVIESVLAQRCDALAGWWALLLEKEGRKVQRRERKRKEREADNRSSRRFSQASSRLNALATVGEDHSKASSTSSNGSVTTTMSKTPLQTGRSPHHSVKVLPATPTTAGFPSNIRLVRDRSGPPLSIFNEGMPSHNSGLSAKVMPAPPVSPSPFGGPFNWNSPTAAAPGVLFAKRKKNLFKGPMLSLGREAKSSGSGSASHSRSASASGLGRRSGEITIQEEDEEAVEEGEAPLREGDVACPVVGEDDVEEVDSFAPVLRGPGETIEEKIYEQGEGIETEEGLQPPAEVIPGKRGKEMGST
ncbi:hypothetical protein P8C59_007548 [Phyllachora maydis]|uniref:Protein kinase domain-containing protein n=1 Tax=Phyllachora maydis TaxID=1825666 RepID=A0AAD9I8Z9_9PEZI|nr:hypothetical protein P8C59_007548 [Phyllachora maydis]